MKHRTEGHTQTTISGDTRADWSEAFELAPNLQVAYVWHASVFTREVLNGMLRIGLRYGHLKRLPRSYAGEKHVEITKAPGPDERANEWFEYEERPGPMPPAEPSDEEIRDILIVGPEKEA